MYFVYILRCKDGSLYTGITTDVDRRFREHQAGRGGHYTRAHAVTNVVYIEKAKNRSAASRREIMVKKLSKKEKIRLIDQR